MKYKLKVYSIWEPGQRVNSEGKSQQEDSIFPAYNQQKDSDRLFILCDGMGGHESGEVASSTVCTAMSNSVLNSVPDGEGDFDDNNLRQAIEDAFNALDDLLPDDVHVEKKMGTTMTFLKFHSKGCTIAHMGDSRVYHIRPGKGRDDSNILFKTNDHSLINDLIKIGELTPEEAKQSKQKNIITRAMQPKMERRPKPDVYHTVDIKPGDYFYMCSDGMLEQMEDENLLFNFSEATGDDENKVNIFTQATSQNLDNHSAIIVHIIDVIDPLPVEVAPVPPVANKPAPIMAEVDEDSQEEKEDVEQKNEDEIIGSEDTLAEHSIAIGSPLPKNVGDILPNQNKAVRDKKGMNIKLIKYILGTLLITLLALGIFFVSSWFSNSPEKEPENIEHPQKPSKKPGRRHHSSDSGQNTSQLSPDKPNGSLVPDKPNSSNQTSTGANSVNSTVPNKIPNAASSQASQSTGNGNAGTMGHVNSTGGNNHNNISTANLNQVSQHVENVVPSDHQVAIDVSNNGKKKP